MSGETTKMKGNGLGDFFLYINKTTLMSFLCKEYYNLYTNNYNVREN